MYSTPTGTLIYGPDLHEGHFYRSRVVNDLKAFKREADVVIANRRTDALADVAEKVYTRDLLGECMNLDGPLLSVISPAFNQQAWLQQCLQSVLAQQGAALEVLVVG